MKIPNESVARLIVQRTLSQWPQAMREKWNDEQRALDIVERMGASGWVVVDARMLAVLTEALRATCRCNAPRDPDGKRVPHDRDCPMFPFDRPSFEQSQIGFLASTASFDSLLASAIERGRP